VIDSTPYPVGTTDWEVSSTARGSQLVLFYRKQTSADTTSGQIYCRVWSQDQQTWSMPQLLSTMITGSSNHWPNGAMSVPPTCSTIPVVWSSVSAAGHAQIYSNRIVLTPPGPCCVGIRGNVDGIGAIDVADLSTLVAYLTGNSLSVGCPEAANVDGRGSIDVSDLSLLTSYLTGAGIAPSVCP